MKHSILYSMLLVLLSMQVSAQIKVIGKVTDAKDHSALPGVAVELKGTAQGTQTDANGSFSLQVPDAAAVLVINYTGYTSQEISAGSGVPLVIQLTAKASALNEVVVVGYGTAKKSDITGAVSSVKASDLLSHPVTNALEALQGRVAGVDIATNSGAPGGLASVIIRGIGSLNSSTDPLYVVDGVAMTNIQFLNPGDIQNIEVLKDASATSIYGARGSNGVILITTKRGSANKGVNVTYDGSVSVGYLPKELPVLNSTQWLSVLEQGMANNAVWGAPPRTIDLSDRRLFRADGTPLYNTDWQKAVTRTSVSTNNQLAIQERGENSSNGVFLNYTYNQGIMLHSDLRRYNVKFTNDTKISPWLDFGANMLVNYSMENEVDPGGGGNTPTRTMIEMPNIFPVHFPGGAYANNQVSPSFSYLDAAENPVKILNEQTNLNTRTQIFGNAFFNVKLTKNLEFKTQFGIDFQNGLYDYYSPSDLLNISSNQNGVASISNEQIRYWQQENFLTYKKNFGIHHINAVLGASWQQRDDKYLTGSTQNFADDYYHENNLGAGSQPNPPYSNYTNWAINSYFARVGYTAADKFLLTLTERIDGSSRFGASNKYGSFPSVGAGYILSNEKFMKNLKAISYLKIRASYGSTGNTEIGSYQSLATINSGTTLINGNRAASSSINGLSNPNLKWEKTNQTDIGLETRFLNDRISFEADYYYKLTSNLLLNKPLPSSTGFGSVLSNIGSMSNQGVDLVLTTKNIQTANFSWTTSFLANYNKNKIVSLGSNNEDIFPGPYWGPVSDGFTILRVGQAAGSFWGYKRLGTYSTADVAAGLAADPNFSHKPGEEKESATKMILGKESPDWNGSFVNTFRYKGFELMVDLQYSQGASIAQAFLFSSEDRTGFSNSLTTVLNGWTPTNQNTQIQQLRFAPDAGQTSAFDSHWVANGSFIRGRNVVFGYNFKQHTLDALRIKGLRLYASGQNLFLITSSSFKGYDPQSITFNSGTTGSPPFGQNIDFYQYPKARTLTFGMNVIF